MGCCGNAWPISVAWAIHTIAAGLQEKACPPKGVLRVKKQTFPALLSGIPVVGVTPLLPHSYGKLRYKEKENKLNYKWKYDKEFLAIFYLLDRDCTLFHGTKIFHAIRENNFVSIIFNEFV